ncbi:MAG: competence/damage-inducible protein A [Acidimicrobiia bacterium]|nr:competence/damage-inducible protein A [Acidimicrobiia bacterium]
MNVEVLAVGTELLLGQIVNGNAAEIGDRLASSGLDHYRQTVVGDNVERITAAIREATGRADALIITGGIGPTQDDLTREALCAAAGVSMEFSEEYADHLRVWWERRGREMPASNLRQAEHPAGATLIANAKGTAPGLRLRIGGCWVFALPGVPQEMLPMVDEHVLPHLVAEAGGGGVIVSRLLRTWGESESRIAEIVGDLYEGHTNPTLAFLASGGEIKLRITARAGDAAAAEALIAPLESEIRRRLGRLVFGAGDDTIERIVLRLCAERGWSVATAESATGGLVAAALTAVPGSSAVVRGGVVAYHPDVKTGTLGVSPETVARFGLVSAETALEMAEGARRVLGADVAVAVTGSAGPDTLEQPAGTMVIAVATPEGSRVRVSRWPGDRERVRVYTTTAALHLLRLGITGEWWSG